MSELVVVVIFKSGDEVLTLKRSKLDEYYPDSWDFPGGHVEDGESIFDAIKREIKEEIGIDLNIQTKLIDFFDEVVAGIRYLELEFLAEVDKNDLNIVLNDEHTEYKWVKKDFNEFDRYMQEKVNKIL